MFVDQPHDGLRVPVVRVHALKTHHLSNRADAFIRPRRSVPVHFIEIPAVRFRDSSGFDDRGL